MYIFYLFKYFDWIKILPEEEDDDVITTSSVRAELNDKICVEYLNDLLKKFDFNKHKNNQTKKNLKIRFRDIS